MAMARISKETVDRLQAGPAASFLWDDELKGFGVRITPSGAKSYIFQYPMGGREAKTQRYTIGRHGSPWTAATSRIGGGADLHSRSAAPQSSRPGEAEAEGSSRVAICGIRQALCTMVRRQGLADVGVAAHMEGDSTNASVLWTYCALVIATGQRREEMSGLSWTELDRKARMWTLPGERTKNGEPNHIPLNDLAVEEFDKIAGGEDWPKRGRTFATSSGAAFSGFAKGKLKLDSLIEGNRGSPIVPLRLHDLRRTVATGFQRVGVRFEVTEAILNHVGDPRAGVAGIHQRHDWKPKGRSLAAVESSSRNDRLGLDRVNPDRFYFGLASLRRYGALAGFGRLRTGSFQIPLKGSRHSPPQVCPDASVALAPQTRLALAMNGWSE